MLWTTKAKFGATWRDGIREKRMEEKKQAEIAKYSKELERKYEPFHWKEVEKRNFKNAIAYSRSLIH